MAARKGSKYSTLPRTPVKSKASKEKRKHYQKLKNNNMKNYGKQIIKEFHEKKAKSSVLKSKKSPFKGEVGKMISRKEENLKGRTINE